MGDCRTPSGPGGSSGKQFFHVPQVCLAGVGYPERIGRQEDRRWVHSLFLQLLRGFMNYQVIARKWRPQSWEDVVAQEHVTVTLRNAIQHNRLAHAYLFTGPRGVGKTSAARILAKALNCDGDSKIKPCNACSSCREIAESRNVDVFEIDGASNRGIDEVRNLRENIQYTPARGKYKIYIIDEVHMLTPPAFNALLKTLEEPPSHVLFIFATTEPHKVPATIVSRCQRFDFRRISTHDIIDRLTEICREEKIDIDEEALFLIARKADGSLRDSQSILDQIVSYREGSITADDVIQGLGLIEQQMFFRVTVVLASKQVSEALALIDEVISGGYDVEEFLAGLAEHLRNLLVVRSLGSSELVEATEDHKKQYLDLAKSFEEEDILRLIRVVLDTKVALKRSLHPRLPLELAMVKMIKLDRTVKIEDLLTRLDSLKSGVGQKPNVPGTSEKIIPDVSPKNVEDVRKKDTGEEVSNSPPPEQKKNVITLEDVEARWEDVIKRLKHKKITVGSFLQEGMLCKIEGNTLEIGFGHSNGFHIDAIMRSREIVLEVLREVLGCDMLFRCVKMDMPQQKTVSSTQEKAACLKKLEEKAPVIRKIIDDFEAELID